jgi:signal peptidase I
LKSRTWLVIGLLVLVLAAGSVFYASSDQHSTGITVKTNGTAVTIQSSSLWGVPEIMLNEMKNKAMADVQDDSSTLASIKADMQSIASKYNYTVEVKISSQFGADQLPMPATVKGTSMLPTLQDGQNIILVKTSDFKVGDIVVARHPDYDLIVKRVAEIKGDQVYLKSDNRKVEVIGTETRVVNGMTQIYTVEKTPLDTWLPRTNVVGVVKVY